MNHGTLLKHGRPRSAGHGHWPHPDEIRKRTRRIRREWSLWEYGARERLAAVRLHQLAEQLLREQ